MVDDKKKKDFYYETQPGKRKRAFNLARYLANSKKKQEATARKRVVKEEDED